MKSNSIRERSQRPIRSAFRAVAVAGAVAVLAVVGFGRTPVAQAAPGDDLNSLYDCGNVVLGFCQTPLWDVLSVPSQLEFNNILQAVPQPQRPQFAQAFQYLGPYGAEGTLRVYANLPQETLNREFSYISNLIQNFSPDYQRALLIDYFTNQ